MSVASRLHGLWEGLRRRASGLRSRLGLMLIGVLVLVLWQTGLAIGYTVELFDLAERVERFSDAARLTAELTRSIHVAADERVPADAEALEARVEELSALSEDARRAATEHEALKPLGDVANAVDDYAAAVRAAFAAVDARAPTADPWVDALEARRAELQRRINAWDSEHPDPGVEEAMAHVSWLRDFTHRLPDRVAAQALSEGIWTRAAAGAERRRALGGVERGASRVRRGLTLLRTDLAGESAKAGAAIRDTVDRADRYLVTLLLLTTVYVGLILFVFPARLARPFRHLASVIRRASQGRYDVRARLSGVDELGDLGDALNEMLAHAATFDELKRERIYQDHARIRRLADLVPHPVAVLDTHFRLAHANRPFARLFHLGDAYEDRDIRERIVGEDAADLHRALDAALRRQRSVTRTPLVISGEREWRLTVEPGRDSHGRTAWLLMRLEPAEDGGEEE
ncbi:MAG: HAMP domain-containing protein [Myxococcota bacterium]